MNQRKQSRENLLASVFKPSSVSLEAEVTDGKVVKEIEHMFYAKSPCVYDLMRAESMEIQEQWGLWHDKTDENAGSGSVRIRKTTAFPIQGGKIATESGVTQYVQTIKIKTASGDALEIPAEASEDGLKAFKLLATSGMVKHRYIFPIAGTELKWEVDMFLLPGCKITDTQYMDDCKVDLEVKDRSTPIPAFPEGCLDAFNGKVTDETTPEQKEIIEKMKSYLSLPNPHVKQVYVGV